MRLRLVFVLWVGVLLSADGHALQTPAKPVPAKVAKTIKLDSSRVEQRQIDRQAVETYSKQKEFIYKETTPRNASWWRKLMAWIWDLIGRIFRGGNAGDGMLLKYFFIFLKYFLIAILVVGVAYGILKLMGLDLRVLAKKSKGIEVPYEESLENIHEIDFDEQLDKAVQEGNYRLAVRLLYLKTLKHLSDRDVIHWQPDKTNQTYVLELQNENQRKEFAQLTYRFEYVWYGEFFIDKQSFEPIAQSFQQFNQQTK
ncbi:DUF4129 domain-containing protein [Pedobacter sp. KR3-3]|uniref:DUF4129 domain-containing protein n=1 Tax=Pedobacter albus TaxID=3113905 RepID=A0ABU7I9J6_9SPHI|nr:DUF4129 domain-containing protein [Pedobacter sp. KR3-3]MEE1946118.1 DUF4129 domain-containing protein [Pedobacter sp. KR3-3]